MACTLVLESAETSFRILGSKQKFEKKFLNGIKISGGR
jgi:hypothetical protein